MVQETVQNHRRWSYQDENSVKGQKEAVTFSQPQVTSQQSNRGKKCPIPSTSCLPSLRLLPGLPGLTAFPRLLRASSHSLRSSSIHGPFQYGPNLLCLPHLFFFCHFYPEAQSSSITTHRLPCLPGRVLHVSHRLAAGLLQNVFTLEPKLLPEHCHAGDGKCEQGELRMLLKLVPRRARHHFCASALFECPESTHHLFPGKAQQYTPGSKPLKSFVGGEEKLNRLKNVAKRFQVYK